MMRMKRLAVSKTGIVEQEYEANTLEEVIDKVNEIARKLGIVEISKAKTI